MERSNEGRRKKGEREVYG